MFKTAEKVYKDYCKLYQQSFYLMYKDNVDKYAKTLESIKVKFQ